MRTTLTLDDDVAARIRAEMRKTGKSMRETVNENLRQALNGPPARRKTFKVRPTFLGLRPGMDYDKVESVLEELDGPLHK